MCLPFLKVRSGSTIVSLLRFEGTSICGAALLASCEVPSTKG